MSLNGLAIVIVFVDQASQAITYQWRHNLLSTLICDIRKASVILKEHAEILVNNQNQCTKFQGQVQKDGKFKTDTIADGLNSNFICKRVSFE